MGLRKYKPLTYSDISKCVDSFCNKLDKTDFARKINAPDYPSAIVYYISDSSKLYSADMVYDTRFLFASGFCEFVPSSPEPKPKEVIIFIYTEPGKHQTVSKTHIRLPKLSFLITLSPEDFFLLFQIIHTADLTQTQDALKINAPAANISSIEETALAPFFQLLIKNYRMTSEYCDRKWTQLSIIHRFADLEPTPENQLYVLQYITALQNDDLIYFPTQSAIQLELSDLDQLDDVYCVPPQEP